MDQQIQPRPEDKVIESFIGYLVIKFYPELRIKSWPDKKRGSDGEIDAIAENMIKKIAIEHTRVESFPNQRFDDQRFMSVIGSLERELQGRINARIHLIVPFGAIPTGINWAALKGVLQTWVLDKVPLLPDGMKSHQIPGVPFIVTLKKSSSGARGFFVARSAQDDPNFVDRLRDQTKNKVKKLAKYKIQDHMTILLIENDDLANMGHGKMISAVSMAYPQQLPDGLDKIWYADTSIPGSTQFWNVTPSSRAKLPLMSGAEELENPPE